MGLAGDHQVLHRPLLLASFQAPPLLPVWLRHGNKPPSKPPTNPSKSPHLHPSRQHLSTPSQCMHHQSVDRLTYVSCRVYRSHQLQLGDLQNILSSIPLPQAGVCSTTLVFVYVCVCVGGDGGVFKRRDLISCTLTSILLFCMHWCVLEPSVSLQEVVTPDVLRPMAQSVQVQDQLTPHLPPTTQPVAAVLTSPQFQQALGLFDSALRSGELGPLLSQFGLGSTVTRAAAAGGGVGRVCPF